jgi:hypothetical protein
MLGKQFADRLKVQITTFASRRQHGEQRSEELPPRILLYMSMALILAPLLAAKVLVARYQPGSRGLLSA